MFLRNLRPREENSESGSALIAVIGVMAVLAVVTVTVAATTVQALGTSTSSRASVQARAAAEAGIDVATAGLQTTGDCANVAGLYGSTVEPKFDAIVAYDEGAGWVNGCPTIDSTLVRVTSTGTAASLGVAGVTAGDQVTLEAIFDYNEIIVQVPIVGSAVYAHTIKGDLKKFELVSASNSVATSVTIKNGDVVCSNGASIDGDLILGDGNADLNNCNVSGSIHVNGNVTVYKSNVVGSVRATGNVTIDQSSVGGEVQAGGTVLITGSTVQGAPASGSTGSGSAVGPPSIPGWTDVPSDPSYWTAAGYQVVNWTGPCTIDSSTAEWANLTNYTVPTAINFLNKCPTSEVVTQNALGATVELKTDFVFLAQQFTLNKLRFTSTADRKVHFIVPDEVADYTPTCAPPSGLTGNITLTNETDFGTTISAMIYTPCKVYSDRDGFRGQMYGGEVEFRQQASLTFVPVGVPGADLTDGLTTPVVTGAELGDRRSFREIP